MHALIIEDDYLIGRSLQDMLTDLGFTAFSFAKSEDAAILAAARIVADVPPGQDFRHAAFIPDVVLERAFREGWFHDRAAWKRWANDPANAGFRTWRGRL